MKCDVCSKPTQSIRHYFPMGNIPSIGNLAPLHGKVITAPAYFRHQDWKITRRYCSATCATKEMT